MKGRNKASSVLAHFTVILKESHLWLNLFFTIRRQIFGRESVRKESGKQRGRVNVEKMRGGGGEGKVINFLLKGWLLV